MQKSIHSREYSVFRELLREARERVGLTQEELAARLGESQSFVSKCERGERRLDLVETWRFCQAMGISFPGLSARLDRALRS